MPTYGKLDTYDESEDWNQYIERLDSYFDANEIDDADKKRNILLSVCGKATYKLIRDLLSPVKPNTKSFADIVKLVKDHKHPAPSEIISRFKFNSRIRKEGESVRGFVAELRSLSEHCNYAATLEAMLRDRLVVGINDDKIQRRLLAEKNLDFAKALEIATAMETAADNAKDIQASAVSSNAQINQVNKPRKTYPNQAQASGVSGKECYRCGGNHFANKCRFRDAECHNCKKVGHLSKKCPNKEENPKPRRKQKGRNHYVDDTSDEEEQYDMFNVEDTVNRLTEPYKVVLEINKTPVTMEIDTGASVSIISEETFRDLGKLKLSESKAKLKTYTGEDMAILGTVAVHVDYESFSGNLHVIVVKGRGPNLLGRDWLKSLKLNWNEMFAVKSVDKDVDRLLEDYSEIFKDELGAVKGVTAKIYVNENENPRYFKARPVPYALKGKIESELVRLEECGIIQPVQFSEWAAPIVPVVKDEKASIPGDTLLLLQHFDETSVTSSKIKRWTLKNALFSRVLHYVKSGWPAKCPSVEMRPFFDRRNELSCQDDILLWGCRVIIPPEGRKEIIQELHEAHPGISRMKSLARSYVWWPNMDKELEGCVLNCDHCQQVRDKPPEAPMHPWEWPSRPWSRLHVDFAGPFMNKMFMIVVDAHSKWMEVCVMKTITSENTIAKLQQIFSTHGIPDTIVSDNGPSFTSREFKQFLQRNGIKQINSAPYHPASNGLAEKAVQTFKQAMKKIKSGTIQEKINNFLFRYRITPHTTTGASPAELLMKRKLKSKLDLVFPNMEEKVVNKQNIQKHYKDKTAKERDFDLESKVYAKNFSSGDKWLPGYITEKSGPLSYRIRLSDDNIIRRHVDHLRPRQTADPVITPDFEIETSTPSEIKPLEETTQSETTEPRYPKRQKREPAYLKDYVR
ncbi:hypothetical protein FSP39_000173 [Pinctada imbricata]|uniref:Endonuclease n=1 Tax=Pinctada imbricata TaxID=66713 RepID=A0AA89BN33_PINIB|nr:hypothetical protein FSP39_000173 [Pinctada imbricata]